MRKDNPELVDMINTLKLKARENKARIWRDIAERLEAPSSNYAEVNLSKIERHANDGDIIVVPGKVLGSGVLSKKVTVAAWKFSQKADEKIKNAGGRTLSILELIDENPKGSNVRIMR